MPLSAKERERIIEEEKLRFETRQQLHQEACGKHRRGGRALWWIAAAVVAYAVWCHFACGGMSCHHGGMMGMGGPNGHHCQYHDQAPDDAVAPGQPLPPKK